MTIFGKIVLGGFSLIAACGIYYGTTLYMSKDAVISQTEVETKTEETALVSATVTATTTASSSLEKISDKKIAFTEFMKKGGAYKCTVLQTVATMTSKGTVYIHDKLIKGNFSTSIQGQTIDANMIIRDGYSYSWTSMQADKGFKTKIVDQTGDIKVKPSSTYSWNGEQIGEYDCQTWTADDSVFELPKSVIFSIVQ